MKNSLRVALVVFIAGYFAHASATTFTAASCNESDVASAVNSAIAAGSGNTVQIPAGTCTWTTALNVSLGSNTSLTILGAGNSTTGGGDVTNIIDGVTHSVTDYTVQITTGGPSTSFRWSGITLENSSTTSNNGVFNIQGTSQQVRIDHNHFANLQQLEVNLNSQIYGVVDHNIFDQADLGIRSLANGWDPNTPGNGDGNGDGSWADSTGLGSNRYMYIEDNVFNSAIGGGQPVPGNDCLTGGRFVIRHNSFNHGSALQTHPTGHDGGNDRGCRSWEIYQNTFSWVPTDSSNVEYNMFFMSSGTGVIWGNTVNGYENFVTMHSMRRNNNTYQSTVQPNGWGYCGTSFTGSGSTWDQNPSSPSGYRCLDEPGSGQGQLISGNFPSKINTATGIQSWPNEAFEPVYEWMDSWTPPSGWPGVFWSVQDTPSFTNNVDFYTWCNAASPSGCTSFNGTAGVGSGTLASRPSTCTTGVAYWATDQGSWNQSGSGGQGVLYKCTATNTWSQFYTPYTYPHPLVSGGSSSSQQAPAPPVNVQSVAK